MFASKGQRIERSRGELERLRQECLDWVTLRHKTDKLQQYKTQLDALGGLVDRACSAIGRNLPALEDDRNLEETFEHCRFLDQRIAWTRRLWEFFKEKFDQRDGVYGPVLRAADEVIWSCYHTPFRNLGTGQKSGPLPYIEAYLSPAAYPREIFPPGLTAEDKAFRRQFNQLPIPLVRVSPLCLTEPWWLIFAAHEAGHLVEYDLGLVEDFKLALEEAVQDSPGTDSQTVALWGSWSREIFADIFSVGAAGPSAALAMADAELGTRAHLLDRQLDGYPPPLVRLSLLDEAARSFGFAPPLPEILLNLKKIAGPLPPEIETDLGLVSLIIKTAFEKIQPEGLRLVELIPPEKDFYLPGGKLSYWVADLRAGRLVNDKNLEAARLLTPAAYQAWREISRQSDPALPLPSIRQALADITLESMQASREEGARAAKGRLDTRVLDEIANLLVSPKTQLPL